MASCRSVVCNWCRASPEYLCDARGEVVMFCIAITWSDGSIGIVGPFDDEKEALSMKQKYYSNMIAVVCHMTPAGLAQECEEEHSERMRNTVTEGDCC